MKVKGEKRLELRPLCPRFMHIALRFPAMVFKKSYLPILNIYERMNIFKKKNPQLQTQDSSQPQMSTISTVQNKSLDQASGAGGDFLKKQDQSNERPPESCESCLGEGVAYNPCLACKFSDPTIPAHSCASCLGKKPLVFLCKQNHEKPTINLSDNAKTRYYQFKEDVDQLTSTKTDENCNGHYPLIYNCPLCSCIWPTVGECNCHICRAICRVIRSSVKLVKSSQDVAHLCPCLDCTYLLPVVKICNPCSKQLEYLKALQISNLFSYQVA